jgi:hypothetical protein
VIDESDLQSQKPLGPRISTLHGIIIDSSDDDENAPDAIRRKRASCSYFVTENSSKSSKFKGIQSRESVKLQSEENDPIFTSLSHTMMRRKKWLEIKFVFFHLSPFSASAKPSNCLNMRVAKVVSPPSISVNINNKE